jgi:hypothetical protein
MRTLFLKLLALCFGMSLASCSAFYTRHYTKGLFYDGFSHRARPAHRPENQEITTLKAKGSLQITAPEDYLPEEKKIVLQDKTPHSTLPENRTSSARPTCIKPYRAFASPVLKKVLKLVNNQIRATQHAGSVIGKAAFYILALVLAVGIVALAIYFLPSILLPAQVVTTFSTILLIGAIIVLCVFAFLIYTLINLLIDLFKHQRTPEEEEF